MPFHKMFLNTDHNVSVYHWLIERLPATFTYEVFEELMSRRYGMTEATEEEIKRTLLKMRKLQMVEISNSTNRTKKALYHVKELYRRHYKKGEFAPDYVDPENRNRRTNNEF